MKIFCHKNGSLLLEILIVIGIVAIVIPIIAQIVVSSLNASKWSMENKIASDLIDEEIKAVEGASFEKWQNIYSKLKTSTNHYYALKSAGAWVIGSGEESVVINGLNYSRYFFISDVCRSDLDKAIVTDTGVPPCAAGNKDDPSTQKITVVVSWRNGSSSREVYLTRWRNQICEQTNWSGTGAGPTNCPSTIYESATNIDTTGLPGSLRLQAN
jgi:hypothetical protein